ncbi:MAG TPA: DUF5107 domain-containing protein [Acidobacteriaceae bacterium]|nr:DUF5107 domain-containing protein [Acidobacteriaceae bacterium]
MKAWEEPVVMRTWLPAPPNPNPLFLERRVYQGSSGRVYPLPIIDRIRSEPQDHRWRAVHLENEYIRIMILPEIGGRIHVGLDKLNGYDFFYRQNVIKPALVGLAGPWISGGVEFNWPQHHRPATFMPVETAVERDADGSVTVWCSDHDPMARMKGMHGLCLHPGKAFLELRVRLYNRTTETQTFLWWANAAVHVHEEYQSFFPPDVRMVADHARRAVTEFPLSQGRYYGVDYGQRARDGVPNDEQPRQFVPTGRYLPNDLSWYGNIPVPTSYMIVGSRGDFFGGYDHRRQAGMVHVANHHVAPGKKQWTWGNHDFGYAWDRHLTESDGPYIELMAGVYTDNQPDFSWLAPGETKTFTQYWYPIREIGVPLHANLHAAVRSERKANALAVHFAVTSARPASTLRVLLHGAEIGRWRGDLHPEQPLHQNFTLPPVNGADIQPEIILEQQGQVLLHYAPAETVPAGEFSAATEPRQPDAAPGNDELFLIGLHLEQYRHPTRSPEPYWQEAIRRDPGDSRAHHALGRSHLRRGELALAEQHLRASIQRLTERNPNPADGEPHYNLGQTLVLLGRENEAYEAYYKSAWNAAWRGPAFHRLAELDCVRENWAAALDHIDRSLNAGADNLNARNLKTIILRRLGREREARELLNATCALDPLDIFSRFLASGSPPIDHQQRLDLIFDLLRAGLAEEALTLACAPFSDHAGGAVPMLLYARAHILRRLGRAQESAATMQQAAAADPAYVFPSRLEEMLLLEEAIHFNSYDSYAHYYLGNLLYDRRRHRDAIAAWERATQLAPDLPVLWRNLGIAYYNVMHDLPRSQTAFEQARRLAPHDARILYEQDQLARRAGTRVADRLANLEAHRDLVDQRDDLSLELATLCNNMSQPDRALDILLARQFQPWEGGEGLVLAQYVRANILLGQRALAAGKQAEALRCFEAAQNPPESIGEAPHLLANRSIIDYWLGIAWTQAGKAAKAAGHWERAARTHGDFQGMQLTTISDMTFWSAMALDRLGRREEARALLGQIRDYAADLEQQTPKIDYFATSLPAMLLFDEDLKLRQTITARFLQAQALLGLEQRENSLDLLQQVLRLDQSHAGAIDLMQAEFPR